MCRKVILLMLGITTLRRGERKRLLIDCIIIRTLGKRIDLATYKTLSLVFSAAWSLITTNRS